jgi:hypothetical protein
VVLEEAAAVQEKRRRRERSIRSFLIEEGRKLLSNLASFSNGKVALASLQHCRQREAEERARAEELSAIVEQLGARG